MHKEPSNLVVTRSDFMAALRRHKKRVQFCVWLCAGLAFLFAVTRPIQYEAKAVFQEKGKSSAGISEDLLMRSFFSAAQPSSDALVAMKSRRLAEALVRKHGLQADIERDEYRFPFLPISTIFDNLKVEMALWRGAKYPVLQESEFPIIVHDVMYEENVPLHLDLEVTSPETYLIRKGREVIASGEFGEPVAADQFSLVFVLNPNASDYIGHYRLRLNPLGTAAEKIQDRFTILSDPKDKYVLKISYLYPTSQMSVAHLNTLMGLYQKHVNDEHLRIAKAQMSYLLDRQKEMGSQLKQVMGEHAQDLSTDLSTTGFATSEKAMEFLANYQQNLRQKLMALELEIQRLESVSRDPSQNFNKFLTVGSTDWLNRTLMEMRTLKQQADALTLALQKGAPAGNGSEEAFESQLSEFQGISPNTAKELYIAYCKELSDKETKALSLEYIIEHMNDPHFEISSLSTVLDDATSAEMISKAVNTSLALRDTENRSTKEQDRLKEDLELQKTFLSSHLKQTIDLLQISQNLLKKKIYSLQSINLSLLENEMDLLTQQMTDYIHSTLAAHLREKALLTQTLRELTGEMVLLPQKWAAEQLIDHQMTMNRTLTEEISKIVETKNITSNLEKIQSIPLDFPLQPVHPKSPKLVLFTLLGAILGLFIGLLWTVGSALREGVCASLAIMHASGYHTSGSLSQGIGAVSGSKWLDSDLETLRLLIAFMMEKQADGGKTLLMLCGAGPNYASALARLLGKRGSKVLIVDICFDRGASSATGLLQYLKGETSQLNFQSEDGFDRLAAGGIDRFANELLGSDRFKQAIHICEKDYDWVLFVSNDRLDQPEVETLLSLFPKVAATLSGETVESLERPLALLAEHHTRITFLAYS